MCPCAAFISHGVCSCGRCSRRDDCRRHLHIQRVAYWAVCGAISGGTGGAAHTQFLERESLCGLVETEVLLSIPTRAVNQEK